MGVAPSNFCCPLVREKPPFPSSALPASGFVGIISARVLKAPLTGAKMLRFFENKKNKAY
jgi:hypothetical protein